MGVTCHMGLRSVTCHPTQGQDKTAALKQNDEIVVVM